jgi:FkbM family methyltransferase
MLIYLRELIVSLPLALIKAGKNFGPKGAWLAFCDIALTFIPVPITLPGFGGLSRRNEARSLLDNFCLGELRCDDVEQAIKASPAPQIIDLGVNLGMSIRWWFSLNERAKVSGVEMMQESLDYTTERLRECHPGCDWNPLCCAVASADADNMEISFSDPLEGTTSAKDATGGTKRSVPVRSLDSLFAADTDEILLLKCDIEGFGGYAMQGGRELLLRTRYVVTEMHGADEMELMSRELMSAGFVPFQLSSRSLWWRRPQSV